MREIIVALWLTVTGCGLMPANFTPAEKRCLAEAEARADLKLAACGKSVEGHCSTDAIIDQQEKESETCLSEN